jgi:hypothetical protein
LPSAPDIGTDPTSSMSAFSVVIGGKADIAGCGANVDK